MSNDELGAISDGIEKNSDKTLATKKTTENNSYNVDFCVAH